MQGFFFVREYNYKGFHFYDNEKKAAPVFYLHGLGGQGTDGLFLQDIFKENRLILVDLPGHGTTLKSEETDISMLASEIYQSLIEQGFEKGIFVGHSLGGQMAILTALIKPEFVSHLFLISPAGLEKFNDMQKNLILTGWRFGSYFQNLFPPGWSGQGFGSDSLITENYMRSMMERPVLDFLKGIECQADVLFGSNDPLIPNRLFKTESPLAFANKAISGLKNFHLTPIPDAGHWPMFENRKFLIKAMQPLVK
ncbi:MAG: alpha/beta fold hydrolase [Bacteroidetes bacterium]|nr:alpha/beta fold hydrolase [Bacteroidota bacterium]